MSAKLPEQFTLPFRFEGHLAMSGVVNKSYKSENIILDTGAPSLVIWVPRNAQPRELGITEAGWIESLVINGVELGPIQGRLKPVTHTEEFYFFLGTQQIKSHCLVLDYQKKLAQFNSASYEAIDEFSVLTYSRGRPVISIDIGGIQRRFVIDTGSNANWLFYSSQVDSILEEGIIRQEEPREAESGLGNIQICRSLLLPELSIGGKRAASFPFYLGGEKDFGGISMTLEDGIIGTGQIAAWYQGLQILDFISGRFYLGEKYD